MHFKTSPRSAYRFLEESGKVFERKLMSEGKLCDPRTQCRFVWFDGTTCHSGLVRQIREDAPSESLRGHSVFPAFEDINAFESDTRTRGHAARLISFAEENPVVLHRMGYFKSYGVRDMHFVSRNGGITSHSMQSPFTVHSIQPSNAPSEDAFASAVRNLATRLLIETPDAYFFLHFLGEDVKLDQISERIQLMPGYSTVQQQVRSSLQVPQSQRANVAALMANEMESLREPVCSYSLSRAYLKEADPASYSLYAGGEYVGFNNSRAMRGMIRRVSTQKPNAVLLAHKSGSQLNFGLVEELRSAPIVEGIIERPQRFKPDGSIH